MPKEFLFNADEVKGTSYANPFIPPVAPAKNTLASDLTGVAVDVVKGVQGDKLQSSLEEQKESFLEDRTIATPEANEFASEESDFDSNTEHENRIISGAKREAEKLNMARSQGRITGEAFKARVEATLKGYINTTPGLSKEFRKIAADTLGFDPTGSALAAEIKAANVVDKTSEKQLNHMAGLLETAGLSDKGDSRAMTVEKYWPIYQQIKANEMLSGAGLKELQNQHEVSKLTQNKAARGSIQGELLNTVMSVKGMLGMKDVTPEALRRFDVKEKAEMIAQLQNARTLFVNQQVGKYADLSPDEIEKIMVSPLKYYDDTIAWLDGKLDADIMANNYNYAIDSAKHEMVSTPYNAKMAAVLSMVKGVTLPPSVNTAISQWGAQILNSGAAGLDGRGDINASLESSITNAGGSPQDVQNAQVYTEKAITQVWLDNKDRLDEGVIDGIYNQMVSYTRNIYSYPEEVQTHTLDNLYNMAKDPEFAGFVKGTSGDTRLHDNMVEATKVYIPRVFAQMDSELDSLVGNKGFYQVEISENGDLSFVKAAPALAFEAEQGHLSSHTNQRVRELNQKFATRLNNTVKAVSHMSGNKNYLDTAVKLLGKSLLRNIGNDLSPELKARIEALQAK